MNDLLKDYCDIRYHTNGKLYFQPLKLSQHEELSMHTAVYVHLGRSTRTLPILEQVLDSVPNSRDPPRVKHLWPLDSDASTRISRPWMSESETSNLFMQGMSILDYTPPASPGVLELDSRAGRVYDEELEDTSDAFLPIRLPSASKWSSMADSPLCIAVDLKSLLHFCKTMSSIHFKRLHDVLARCIVDNLDMPSGDHCSTALTCLRTIQYDKVLVENSNHDSPTESARPRLLRFHYPYVFVHPFEKRHVASAVARELNEAEVFGVTNWHTHMHSLMELNDPVPILVFDWINVSNPSLVVARMVQDSDDFTIEDVGFPTEEQLSLYFPEYIHEHAASSRLCLDALNRKLTYAEFENERKNSGHWECDVNTDASSSTEGESYQMDVLRRILDGCAAEDCGCSCELRHEYLLSVDAFHRDMALDSHKVLDSLTKACRTYPTCPCTCTCSPFRQTSLLPLMLSNGVRYRLNFGRGSETNVSCNFSKSDLLDITEMISKSRMEVDEDNLSVLRILQTCFPKNSNTGMQLWRQLCWRLGVYTKESIWKEVYFTKSTEYHMPSMLQHIAADDDVDSYTSWRKKRLYKTLRRCLGSMTDTEVAVFISVYLEGSWVWCPSGKDGRWYHFNKLLWAPQVHEVLPRILSTMIQVHLSKVMDKLSPSELNTLLDSKGKMVDDITDLQAVDPETLYMEEDSLSRTSSDGDRTNHRRGGRNGRPPHTQRGTKMSTVGERLSKLKEGCQLVHFKNTKIKELKEVMYIQDFESKLNSAPDRLAVNDGVILVRKNRVDVCRMRMQHMCSMTTNQYLLRHNFSYSHPMVSKVNKWIGMIFPDEDLRNYFWKYMASVLYSGNGDKIFMVWTGDGDNSKSMLIKLVQKALGDYCVKLPACMLSEKEGHSTTANPCKAMASKCKLAVFDEPDDSEQLRSALIKSLSGADVYYNRDLYEKGRHHTVTFKMVMVCNKVPPIRNPDVAIRRRFVIIPFDSIWVDNPPETEEEQHRLKRFKKDPRFEQQLDYMAPAFLWLMCDKWKNYAEEGLEDKPAAVAKATTEYFNDSNLIEVYVRECLEILEPELCMPENSPSSYSKEHIVKATVLYSHYRKWQGELQSKHAGCMLMKSFQKELCLIVGEDRLLNNNWLGIVIRRYDDGRKAERTRPSESILGRSVEGAVHRYEEDRSEKSTRKRNVNQCFEPSRKTHKRVRLEESCSSTYEEEDEFEDKEDEDEEDEDNEEDEEDEEEQQRGELSQRLSDRVHSKMSAGRPSRSAMTSGFVSADPDEKYSYFEM